MVRKILPVDLAEAPEVADVGEGHDELAGYVTRHLPALTDQQQIPSIETRFGGDLFVTGL